MNIFEITIQRQRKHDWPVVVDYREPGQLSMRREGILRMEGDWQVQLLQQELTPRTYGSTLGMALFRDRVRDAFMQARRSSQGNLRVLLLVEDQKLRHLHWEWLCAPIRLDGGWDLLALDQQVMFSLYLPSPTDRRFPPISRQELKSLVLVADPPLGNRYELAPFDALATVASIKEAMSDVPYDILANVDGALGPPTLNELAVQLTVHPYTLLHIVAHGQFRESVGETIIYLLDDDKQVAPVAATQLLERLDRLQGPKGLPQFAFLATCESAQPEAEAAGALGGLAQRLVRQLGMPAVVAMTQKVSISTAQALASSFYARLWEHGEPDRALVKATSGLADRGDVTVPALYSRLGGRRLFETEDREPTDRDHESALAELERLLPERAPVLQDRLAILATRLREILGERDQEEWTRASAEINAMCQDVMGRSFRGLALGQKPLGYDSRCPFPGLLAFQASDQEFFFGRERLVEELEEKLIGHNFLSVLGPSGSGKSSLVLAGLFPALQEREPDLRLAYLTPGIEPLARLDASLNQVEGQPHILVVDQFEELFTHGSDEEKRQNFIDRLLQLAKERRVVMTMRADFWGDCAPYRTLVDLMQAQQELVAPMSEGELRSAMEQQARSVGFCLETDLSGEKEGQAEAEGLWFEADLANTILEDVRGEPGAMPLLQHALRKLWERRHGAWLKASEYRAIGRTQGAIAKTADDLYATLSPSDQYRVRDIFVRLTSLDEDAPGQDWRDTRRRVAMGELVPAGAELAATRVLVNQLATTRLVVIHEHQVASQAEVEVAHEALLRHWPLLRGWLKEDREILELREGIRRAALEWAVHEADQAYLLHHGERLSKAEVLIEHPRFPLNDLEMAYVQACVALRTQDTMLRLHSAVVRHESVGHWLTQLRSAGGQALIQQLEESPAGEPAQGKDRIPPVKLESLLGLPGATWSPQPGGGTPFGPVAQSAVSHDDPITRQTAGLLLTVPYRAAAADRLESALDAWAQQARPRRRKRLWQKAEVRPHSLQRLWRKAEVLGNLAEADPDLARPRAELKARDRAGMWMWRTQHRVRRDGTRIAGLTLGGALGAGLGLGLLRAIIAILAGGLLVGVQFALYLYWGGILGGAICLGMVIADSVLLRASATEGRRAAEGPGWRRPTLVVGMGTLFFGVAQILVAWLNGLSLFSAPLVLPLGFLFGLGLSLALYDQPMAGWRLGWGRSILRVGTAAALSVLTQAIFVLARDKGVGITIAWSGIDYERYFSDSIQAWWPALAEDIPAWYDWLGLLDAALVGAVLAIGITMGLSLSAKWLDRWRTLIDRASE